VYAIPQSKTFWSDAFDGVRSVGHFGRLGDCAAGVLEIWRGIERRARRHGRLGTARGRVGEAIMPGLWFDEFGSAWLGDCVSLSTKMPAPNGWDGLI
jgi:hypothetical protein